MNISVFSQNRFSVPGAVDRRSRNLPINRNTLMWLSKYYRLFPESTPRSSPYCRAFSIDDSRSLAESGLDFDRGPIEPVGNSGWRRTKPPDLLRRIHRLRWWILGSDSGFRRCCRPLLIRQRRRWRRWRKTAVISYMEIRDVCVSLFLEEEIREVTPRDLLLLRDFVSRGVNADAGLLS